MGRTPILESFDPYLSDTDPKDAPGPSDEWCLGYSAGLAEGHATAVTSHNNLTAEIVQSFADMGFGFSEARAQILQGLKPLFGALLHRVLPGLAQAAFTAQVVDLLHEAALKDSLGPMELAVNPFNIKGLSDILPYAVGMPVVLIGSPAIAQNQAVLRAGRNETVLDVGAVLDGVQSALEAIFETSDERSNYG